MPDYGFGALAIGTGAQAGLQDLIKRRLLERQMALQEQAQRDTVDYRNRDLAQRALEAEETRKLNDSYRQDASNQRWAGIEQKAGDNLVQSKPVGGDISDDEAGLLNRTGNAGVIRAIPMAGETIEGGTPKPIRFKGYTPQEAMQIETRNAASAEREATRTDAESLRRELQEDQQQFMAGQSEANRNFQQQMAREKASTPQVKPPTGAARGALKFFMRAANADDDAAKFEDEIANSGLIGQMQTNLAPNFLQSTNQQRYRQAQRSVTEARLRKDSGAAIPPSEFENDAKMYFVQPGDSPEVVEQKRKHRAMAILAMSREAAGAMGEEYDDPDAEIDKWRQRSQGGGKPGNNKKADPLGIR